MTDSKQGCVVVVVGPSGSGKDTLLKAAHAHFEENSQVTFARRVITRPCDPKSEIHDSVSQELFLQQREAGAFSISWQANNLYYGIPADVHDDVAQGKNVIINGSRAAIPEFRKQFSSLRVISITVAKDELFDRLKNRKRESIEEIEARLVRNDRLGELSGEDVSTIDNSGPRGSSIPEFISLLEAL